MRFLLDKPQPCQHRGDGGSTFIGDGGTVLISGGTLNIGPGSGGIKPEFISTETI
jgi:hypothetical protein